MASPAPAGGSSFLTQKYGPLAGWQWVAMIGGGGGLYLYYRQRKAAAANAAGQDQAGTAAALDAAGAGPLPGASALQPIIIQQGAESEPISITNNPPGTQPTTTGGLTKALFPKPGLPGEEIVSIIPYPKAGAQAGYALTNYGGVEAIGGAPFRGSYLGLPAAARQGSRMFRSIALTPNGYNLYSTAGEVYRFPNATGR